MATKNPRMKFSYITRNLGGPWSITDMQINGISLGTLKTRSKAALQTEIDRYTAMDQDELRKLLRARVRKMHQSIQEVSDMLGGLERVAEDTLKHLK